MEADRESRERSQAHFGLAQAYNHMIMPLANRRDKYTQILWGIQTLNTARAAAGGMWLPETGWT